MNKIYIVVLTFIMSVNSAYAYLDPGTSSVLMSSIVAVASTLIYMGKGYFYKIFTGKNSKPKNIITKHEIIIWSEAKHYWATFAPMIKYLNENDIPFTYMASDKDDIGLLNTKRNEYIGCNSRSLSYLNQLQAKVMVMTTPNLGYLAIKRSKNIKHYVHLVHAPADIYKYHRIAFEGFDSIMCAGEHQIKSIRTLEKIRHTMPKNLLQTGCLYYDNMIGAEKNSKKNNKRKTILLAPTWGNNNMLLHHNKIIPPLLQSGFDIIIRPHPQSFKTDKKLLNQIQRKYHNTKRIKWDKQINSIKACQNSDIMISHLSGVLLDYIFVHKKPALVLDLQQNYQNMEGADMEKPNTAWEVDLKNVLFNPIKITEMDNIIPRVEKALKRRISPDLGQKYLYNFQSAGTIAGQQLVDIYNKVKKNA